MEKDYDLKLFTWNVLTLYRAGALRVLSDELKKYKADIVALQEIRWIGKGVMKKKDYDLYYSCHNKKHEFGTGFWVSKRMKNNVIAFEPVNERICKLRIRGRFYNTTLITVHAPTEEKDDAVKEKFYDDLENVVEKCQANDMKIILGDFNAQVGKENIYRGHIGKHSLHNITNNNGIRLVNFAASKNLFVGSTKFERKDLHKATWKAPNGQYETQIDHVLIDKRHLSSLLNVRTYRSANIDSDHYLVASQIRNRISTVQNRGGSDNERKFDVEALKNTEKCRAYQNELVNRIIGDNINDNINGSLSSRNNVDNIEPQWHQIESAIKMSAQNTIGFAGRRRQKDWFDEECKQVTKNKNEAYRLKLQRKTRAADEEYKRLRRLEKSVHKRKKRESEKKKLEILEQTRRSNDVRKFYKSVNESRKPFKPKNYLIRGINGDIITEQSEILERWAQYFENHINQNTIAATESTTNTTTNFNNHSTNLEENPPTIDEIEAAILKLQNNKSPGDDNIPAELFKEGREVILSSLQTFIENVWFNETLPKSFKSGVICPLHKKGDAFVCDNYRAITLLNIGYKILSNIIYERLKKYTQDVIGKYQCGFTSGRSTTDQIFMLRQIIEKSREFDMDTYHLFIDFRAAYDSINKTKLYAAMEELGIPQKLIRLVKCTMTNLVSVVKIEKDKSRPFAVNNGLRQGDSLACLLFNIALEKVIREAEVETRNTIFVHSTQILAFADDIDLVSRSLPNLKENFIKLEKAAENMGLKINESKTKLMYISSVKSRHDRLGQNFTIGEYNFEVVEIFIYLGSLVTKDNNMEEEIKRRILLANKCYYGLQKHMKSKIVSKTTKIRLYKTLILPTLMYGCETWTLTKASENLLGCFERKILRKIYGPVQLDQGIYRRRYNDELYNLYQEPDVVTKIKVARLRWIGHIERKDDDDKTKKILFRNPDRTRRRGRPKQRWLDCVEADIRKLNIRNWRSVARDRTEWQSILRQVLTLGGL
jgi:endonuclease/exonuclease/phosphatase family metal-dependent hydrolase